MKAFFFSLLFMLSFSTFAQRHPVMPVPGQGGGNPGGGTPSVAPVLELNCSFGLYGSLGGGKIFYLPNQKIITASEGYGGPRKWKEIPLGQEYILDFKISGDSSSSDKYLATYLLRKNNKSVLDIMTTVHLNKDDVFDYMSSNNIMENIKLVVTCNNFQE